MSPASGTVGVLRRGMGLPGVLFLTLSAATPASSFFVIVPDVLRQVGAGALWAMLAAALVAAAMAQVYAELASAFPYAGGEYAIVARVLGAEAGFAMLAVNGANLILAAAVLSLGVAEQLAAVWPGAPATPVALACVALATGLGLLEVRTNAWVTGAFLVVELGALAVVSALGFAHPARGGGALLAASVGAGGVAGPVAFAGAVAVALFAYDGYGSAVYFGEELAAPRRRMALAVTGALALVVATELAPLVATLVGAPDLRRLAAAGPAALVAARAGPRLAGALALAVALAVFNAVIAMLLLSARQLYGAARDGALPAAGVLTRVDARRGSPVAATLAAGGAAALLCLLPLRVLVMLTGAGVTVIYAGLCVALAVGRRTGSTRGATHRAPLHPWTTGLVLAALLSVLALDAADPGDGRTSLLVTLGLAAAGAVWGRWRARSGLWRLTSPADDESLSAASHHASVGSSGARP